MKLKKGSVYALVNENGIGVGRYIGRINGFCIFRGGDFSFDCGSLSHSVKEEDIAGLMLIEIPKPNCETGSGVYAFLEAVLPA